MSSLFEEAIEKIWELPVADQDEAAGILLALAAKRNAPLQLDEKTRVAIEEGRAQARRFEFATNRDIDDFLRRHGVKPRDV